jgi:hypothetical protein
MGSPARLHILLVASLLLSACTSTVNTRPADNFAPAAIDPAPQLEDLAWWQLRFKLSWPADESPDFSGHLLIAEQILLPLIIEHQEDFALWRFHRRAGRDNAGHQFSLIFMADENTAAEIGSAVEADELVLWLQQRGMLEKTRLGQRGAEELGRLEETSDRGWPLEIQKSWPWFAMGASTTWLMQVQEISARQGLPANATYAELHDHYRRVSSEMNAQWRDFGQHAYFHHLSAIYGYQPVKIRSSELRTF